MNRGNLLSMVLTAFLITATSITTIAAQESKPAPGHLLTRWAKDVNPASPLPEYPRPQLVRKEWTNLNGLWDYAITELDVPRPTNFDGKILVPFPIESALSGVKKPLTGKQRLWYRRTFSAPKLTGQRLLLHFGAVDWEAKVFINGKPVGEHRGGFDAFTFDITDAVKPGADNELVVAAFDETGGMQPKGKQHLPAIAKPGGIMYTPCSGIWQTVWLEVVPATHIESLKIVPDVEQGVVRITVNAFAGKDDGNLQATVEVFDGQTKIGSASGWASQELVVKIANPKLWSPESPFLYTLQVTASGQRATLHVDKVSSYFGMRKIALGKDEKGVTRPMLNGKFVFQVGPLDQGFWPDGIYTAPTDEALRYDIEATKKLGFNMCRKHVKVEPDRWYYWADKLGLLVWQDMPSGGAGKGDSAAKQQFESELKHLIEGRWLHPSIIMWVVFNEGWGQYDTERLTAWVKELDPSRLVNNASGWTDKNCGDVIDMHNYPGPGCPKPEPARAAVLGEFGGLGLAMPGHTWVEKTWGYRGMADQKSLTRKYCELWQKTWQLKDSAGLCAAVYTQTTDVETECNGLLTYDRAVIKVDVDKAADAARGKFPPPPIVKVLVPTSETEAQEWRYTTTKPAEGWELPDFDDSSWQKGAAGFGGGNVPNATPRTPWRTDDIWLRRKFRLDQTVAGEPNVRLYHDEDATVFINGKVAAKLEGYVTNYVDEPVSDAGKAALRKSDNVLAVHSRQTGGGQFIDVGLVDLVDQTGK